MITVEKGKYPDPFVAFLSTACYHCAEPSCVSACPVGAITKKEKDGVVVVDRKACLGKRLDFPSVTSLLLRACSCPVTSLFFGCSSAPDCS
ncbi:4Fe-4S dicluster domain-containing protein [Chloroflexota bacterium]